MVLARQQAQAARGEPAQTLDLAALAREALAEATPALSAAGLTAAYDGPADGARIHGHAEALRIALRNLLDNAAKYTPRGGRVVREAGPMKGGTRVIAFVEDPDGYKIELVEDHA